MNPSELLKRQRQLRNLVVMAMADGQIGEREVNLVADRCAELGLSESDLHDAVLHGLDDEAALELPASCEERESLMVDLIRMMGADGRLDENEKRLFALAAVKMAISPERLDRLIDTALE